MRAGRIFGALSRLNGWIALAFLVPLLVALIFDARDTELFGLQVARTALGFLAATLGAWFLNLVFALAAGKRDAGHMPDREAYLAVGVGSLTVTAVAGIPFMFGRARLGPTDAWFEAISGWTATSASIIGAPGDLQPSILLWRVGLQAVGTLAMIVLSLAILSRFTLGHANVARMEASGHAGTRVRPAISATSAAVAKIFGLFSAVLFLVLAAHDLTFGATAAEAFLNAAIQTVATMSAGGFGGAPATGWSAAIMSLFMLITATNFALHHHALRGRPSMYWRDSEFRWLLIATGTAWLVLTIVVWRGGALLVDAIMGTGIVAASTISGAGSVGSEAATWPAAAKLVLIILMLSGASVGSAAGGLKLVRVILLVKLVRRELRKMLHPRAVIPIRFGGASVRDEALFTLVAFFFATVTIWMAGTFAFLVFEPRTDLLGSVTLAASSIGNVGPFFGGGGQILGYDQLTASSRALSGALMLIGRMEVFAILLLFRPASWRN